MSKTAQIANRLGRNVFSATTSFSARKHAQIFLSWAQSASTKRFCSLCFTHLQVREEADELAMTAEQDEGTERAESELADVIYHAIVLLIHQGGSMKRVLSKLRSRFSQSGIAEKIARGKQPE
jgi:phosphoribosyl-ATP pyrophosphohydrolase